MSNNNSEMIARRKKLLGSAYRLFYNDPMHFVRGEGVWLYDQDGRKYLDMYNNVPHVGHCNPHVIEAVTNQLQKINVHTRYLHENILDYTEQLLGTFEDELDNIMLTCSGSEANELALRLARNYTGNKGVIVTEVAYHGNTASIYEISPRYVPKDQLPDYVVSVPSPDPFRGQYRGEDTASLYANDVVAAIETLRSRGYEPAAFIMDTIASSDGVVEPPKGYLKQVAGIIREAGGLFIADEVQAGFARPGESFWGYQVDDVVPDLVSMGKPMGNGIPLAGIATRSEIIDVFSQDKRYFNTFGGSPVACAAGHAVLQVIERENLQENARIIGDYLSAGLRNLADRFECIGDVRGRGLFVGVDLVSDRETRAPATALADDVVNGLKDRGILTCAIGPHSNILKLRPPMVITQDNADYMLGIFEETLSSL